MVDGTRRTLAVALWILLHLFLAGRTTYLYLNSDTAAGPLDAGIRSGPHRQEKFATKMLSLGVAITGAAISFKRRAFGFGLMAASYLVETARLEVFHVREGGPIFDGQFMIPWMWLIVGLLFFWMALVAHQREARSACGEDP